MFWLSFKLSFMNVFLNKRPCLGPTLDPAKGGCLCVTVSVAWGACRGDGLMRVPPQTVTCVGEYYNGKMDGVDPFVAIMYASAAPSCLCTLCVQWGRAPQEAPDTPEHDDADDDSACMMDDEGRICRWPLASVRERD